MRSIQNCFRVLLAFGGLAPLVLHAQTSPVVSPADYTGPRYPGGPDSLRALVYRSTRQAGAAPAGKVLVLLEIEANGHPANFAFVTPPGPVNSPLFRAAGTAVDYLQERMLTWQLGASEPAAKPTAEPARQALMLDFSNAAPNMRPYSYADQMPQFPAMEKLLGARQLQYVNPPLTDPSKRAAFVSSAQGLALYVQMQVRYPAEALRYQQEGRVSASFEVAETGAIEHVEILGTAGRALDAEVLRVVQRLPAAGSPALVQGRPARVHYVLPITFRIQ
ncbi:MAG: energy transducer TonB [Bacteroidota bacterium]|nr:energy transducer TonB [Bacteroidota bacterium]